MSRERSRGTGPPREGSGVAGVDRLPSGLVRVAFGARTAVIDESRLTRASFLPADALDIDLSDAEQRDFGDYQLRELLGRGGMGSVYRAHQHSLDRDVAVKLLAAGPWASPDFIERFRSEARSAALLQHPNIVTVFEFGERDGLFFYAMQLVEGESLAEKLARDGPLSPRAAAALLRTLAEAVDYAHRLGILHLDLKPGNVLSDADGTPRIADFGLARRIDAAGGADNDIVAGTPGYMAPEQSRPGRSRLGTATDIWGLGAIGYELLTGRPPFLGDSPEATLRRLQAGDEVIPPRRLRPEIPRDLDAVILHCLRRDPAARYASARALADDLGNVLAGRAVTVRPLNRLQRALRWMRREPRLALASGVALAALLGGLAATTDQWLRAEENAAHIREQLWQQRLDDAERRLHAGSPLDALPALVDNLAEQEAAGAIDAAELTRTRIGSVLAESPALIDVIATGDAPMGVQLDPDGKWAVVMTNSGDVQRYDLARGALQWSTRVDGWVPELRRVDGGRQLIIDGLGNYQGNLRPSGIFAESLLGLDSGALRAPPAAAFPGLVGAQFSRDGSHALVATKPTEGDAPTLQLVRTADWTRLGDSTPQRPGYWLVGPGGRSLANAHGKEEGAGFLEPGHRIDVFDAPGFTLRWSYAHPTKSPLRVWRYAPDGGVLGLGFIDGATVLLDTASGQATQLRPQPATAVADLLFSADSHWLAASHADGSVRVWDRATRQLVAPAIGDEGSQPLVRDIDRERRTVFVASNDHARLWRLPEDAAPAELVVDLPRQGRPVPAPSAAAATAQGLLAGAGLDGELRLWRYRERTPLPVAGAPQIVQPDHRRFDGRHAVIVDGDRATLFDLVRGEPAGPALAHTQPVGFARLLADGTTVVSTAGRDLHVHDGSDGRARFPPIALAATPGGLLVSPSEPRILVAYSARIEDRNTLVLEAYDAHTGARTGRIAMDGPSYTLRHSERGDHVLAWRYGELHVLDAATLRPSLPVVRFGHDIAARVQELIDSDEYAERYDELLGQPVRSAQLSETAGTLWVVTGIGREEGYRLHAIDANGGGERTGWRLPLWSAALQPLGGGRRLALPLHQFQRLRFYDGVHGFHSALVPGLSAEVGLALSGDGRRLVAGLDRGAQLFDAASGNWLTPPLVVAGATGPLAGVAVDHRGERLVLRGAARRLWPVEIRRERRAVSELAALATLLSPGEEEDEHVFAPPRDAVLRERLRASDPGPPRIRPVPALPDAANAPSRMAPDPHTVDLRPHCNFTLAQSVLYGAAEVPIAQVLTPGRHRLLGIDYDVSCGILTRYDTGTKALARVDGIALGGRHAAALHMLFVGTGQRRRTREPYAIVEFAYADGGRARTPVLYGRDVNLWWVPDGDRSEARIALVGLAVHASQRPPLTTFPAIHAVRLVNPHPERPITSLALEAAEYPWSAPLLLAVTLEAPAAKATGAGATHP